VCESYEVLRQWVTHTLSLSLSLALLFLVFWWCSVLDGFNKAFNVVFFSVSTKNLHTKDVHSYDKRECTSFFRMKYLIKIS